MRYSKKTLEKIYQRIVGAMSGLSTIDVTVHDSVTPQYNPLLKSIWIPTTFTQADTEEEAFDLSRGEVVHEASHVLFAPKYVNTVKAIAVKHGDDVASDFMELLNCFLDVNNEYKVTQLWPHLKVPLVNKEKKRVEKEPERLIIDHPFMQIIYRCDQLWKAPMQFPKGYPDYLQKFIEDTVRDFEKKKVFKLPGKKVMGFTKKIFAKWRKVKAAHHNAGKETSQAVKDLMKQLSKAIQNGNSDLESELNDKINKLQQQGKKWFSDKMDTNKVRASAGGEGGEFSEADIEVLKKELEKQKRKQIKEKLEKQQASKKCGSGGSKGAPPLTRNIEYPSILEYERKDDFDTHKAYIEGKQINHALIRKVRLAEAFENRHRSGDIDMVEVRKQISQVGKVYNSTMFKRMYDFQRGGEWAVSVMVDCSGSMHGYMMSDAKQALCTLGYAFDKIPHIHFELFGFDCVSSTCIHYVKKFKEKFSLDKLKRLSSCGGTPTGTAMRVGINNLHKLRNMQKLLIVITDGRPSCDDDCTRMSKAAEDLGIKVIGIGIGDAISLKHLKILFGKRCLICEMTDDLDKKLTSIILEALHNPTRKRLIKRPWD